MFIYAHYDIIFCFNIWYSGCGLILMRKPSEWVFSTCSVSAYLLIIAFDPFYLKKFCPLLKKNHSNIKKFSISWSIESSNKISLSKSLFPLISLKTSGLFLSINNRFQFFRDFLFHWKRLTITAESFKNVKTYAGRRGGRDSREGKGTGKRALANSDTGFILIEDLWKKKS